MIGTRFRKGRVLGISVTCSAMLLLGGIWVSGFHGLARAADNTPADSYKEIAKTMVRGTAAGLGEALKGMKSEREETQCTI